MRKKSLVVLLAAMFAVFAFSGVALAEDRVEVKVNSEPIPFGSSCYKAGGFSLEFDSDTTLEGGQRITIDLDDPAKVCDHDIDLIIAPGPALPDGTSQGWTAPAGTTAYPPQSGCAVIVNDDAANPDNFSHTGVGVYFHVHASEGSSRITVDVLGDTFTIGGDTEDSLIVSFLDQEINYATPSLWWNKDQDTDEYEEQVNTITEIDQNTLCMFPDRNNNGDLDAGEEWDDLTEKIQANMDSKNDKFAFIPSNPQIAHVKSGGILCRFQKGQKPGGIEPPEEQEDLAPVQLETTTGAERNRIFIINADTFDDDVYSVSARIVSPSNGVYWSKDLVSYTVLDSSDAEVSTGDIGNVGDYHYYDQSDRALDTKDIPTPGEFAGELDADEMAASFRTDSDGGIFTTGNGQTLVLELPEILYTQDAQAGDEIQILLEFKQEPCSTLCSDTFHMATFTDTLNNDLLFPYFTDNSDPYWDGIAITNLSGEGGEVKVVLYESDGDIASTNITLAKQEVYVNLLSAMLGELTLTDESDGDGELGNARGYIMVESEKLTLDGFAMIANSASGESMGYLPRRLGLGYIPLDPDKYK